MLYVAAQNGFGDTGIQFINVPAGGAPINNITLNYVPSGMAADSVHERLYVANSNTNQIQVYSTTTFQLLTTIQ
jgi:DNA-binding beta-propeller fold protein YncE